MSVTISGCRWSQTSKESQDQQSSKMVMETQVTPGASRDLVAGREDGAAIWKGQKLSSGRIKREKKPPHSIDHKRIGFI